MAPNQLRFSGLTLVLAFLPGVLGAQTVGGSFLELQKLLRPDELIVVVDNTGNRTWGQAVKLSASSLVLRVADRTRGGITVSATGPTQEFSEEAVSEILRLDVSGTGGARVYWRPPQSFRDLARVLKTGQTVVVTEQDGRKTRGKVLQVSAASLEVGLEKEQRRFGEGAVSEIKTQDGLGNGIGIGLAAGGGLGYLLAIIAGEVASNGSGSSAGPFLALIGSSVGGALIGAGIDSSIVGRPLYSARQSGRGGSASLRLSPLLAPRRKGAVLSIAF